MKVYETRTRPAEQFQSCIKRQCDLCGVESQGEDWRGGMWKVNESEVGITAKCKTGTAYPESGSGEQFEIDICPKCFFDKLVPWVNSQRSNELPPITPENWDW